MTSVRNQHEIEHGKFIAQQGPENVWGWGSPAGKIRAQRRADLIVSAAKINPEKSVLEIGCGTGDFTCLFSKSGAKITAIDISEDLIQIALKNISNLPNIKFINSSFESLSPDLLYDAVIGSSILHHLDIEPAIKQIYKILKPGGRISFAEPNMLNPQIMLQKNIPWIKQKMGDSPDETAFYRWQMARYLHKIGFIDVCITPFDWLHPLIPKLLIQPISSLGKCLEMIPAIKEFAGSLLISAKKTNE